MHYLTSVSTLVASCLHSRLLLYQIILIQQSKSRVDTIHAAGSYLRAVVVALRLNTEQLVVEVLEQVPQEQIHYLVGALPLHHVISLLKFLVDQVIQSLLPLV